MSDDTEKPRAKGEAAWKADREAMEQRNAATKRRAREQPAGHARVAIDRQRRLEVSEASQLRALNERLGARPPQRS